MTPYRTSSVDLKPWVGSRVVLTSLSVQEKLKSSSGQFSHELDSLLNFVMEHYSVCLWLCD